MIFIKIQKDDFNDIIIKLEEKLTYINDKIKKLEKSIETYEQEESKENFLSYLFCFFTQKNLRKSSNYFADKKELEQYIDKRKRLKHIAEAFFMPVVSLYISIDEYEFIRNKYK